MRKLLVGEIPRDQLPDLTDRRWKFWSERLKILIGNQPTDWSMLEAYGKLTNTSDMAVRNLIAYLEGNGYAVCFRDSEGIMVWCGCKYSCPVYRKGCPKKNVHRRLK